MENRKVTKMKVNIFQTLTQIDEFDYLSIAHVCNKKGELLFHIPLFYRNCSREEAELSSYEETKEKVNQIKLVDQRKGTQRDLEIDLIYSNCLMDKE
jgi:hypothetical protein